MGKRQAILKIFTLFSLSAGFIPSANAQQWSVSTNVATWADGFTINADAAVSVARHWSVDAGVRYNPYAQVHRERSFAVGGRYWPWYSYSGWWLASRLKYQEFNDRADFRTEGDRVGGSFSAGYSAMLGKHFNLDFGLAMWSGHETYTTYRCNTCGRIDSSGEKYFILPDEIIMGLTYVF